MRWQYMIAMISTSLPAFPAGAHARVYALAIHTSLPPHPSIPPNANGLSANVANAKANGVCWCQLDVCTQL